ncbi:hypothetical protein CQW23_23231 [Capsicum baccatum]|uniref:Uncharacterized protein n=1 Tax=Capsicum baccatum TaxID=33114 RepID=A0A2G2VRC7_CAPBA|nr:hypothetical protein CQW23_23231 [Capsicum baccatum]
MANLPPALSLCIGGGVGVGIGGVGNGGGGLGGGGVGGGTSSSFSGGAGAPANKERTLQSAEQLVVDLSNPEYRENALSKTRRGMILYNSIVNLRRGVAETNGSKIPKMVSTLGICLWCVLSAHMNRKEIHLLRNGELVGGFRCLPSFSPACPSGSARVSSTHCRGCACIHLN